jgi:hypothetical protein
VKDQDINYDVIYVDGNHGYKDVLYDGLLSWNLLKSDGLLIFDDGDLVRDAVNAIVLATNADVVYDKEIIVLQRPPIDYQSIISRDP